MKIKLSYKIKNNAFWRKLGIIWVTPDNLKKALLDDSLYGYGCINCHTGERVDPKAVEI